jgi:hypothetical protein
MQAENSIKEVLLAWSWLEVEQDPSLNNKIQNKIGEEEPWSGIIGKRCKAALEEGMPSAGSFRLLHPRPQATPATLSLGGARSPVMDQERFAPPRNRNAECVHSL